MRRRQVPAALGRSGRVPLPARDTARAMSRPDWTTLPDGHEALLVDGGGVDGGRGVFFANAGDELHAYGPLIPGTIGCVVLKADGTRVLAGVQPDPLTQ
jgi:hypothetical protein